MRWPLKNRFSTLYGVVTKPPPHAKEITNNNVHGPNRLGQVVLLRCIFEFLQY